MEPQLAIKSAEALEAAFRRDYLVASVVTLLLINAGWAYALRAVLRKLTEVQEARVQDQKEGERRAEVLVNRMAVHMDKSTEATVAFLARAQSSRRTEKVP